MAKSKSYGGLIFLLIIGGAAAGGWYYFNGKTNGQPEFQTAKVTRGDLDQTVTATGDLQPVVTVDVGAQVSGQIKDVLVDFNSRVKAGDVLALIDESTPVQRLKQTDADLESSKASNRLQQINVQRTRELFEKKLVSQQELDNAEAQLAQSNATLLTRSAAVANAKLDVERCTIRSPIDGIVLNRQTDKGRTVNSSMNSPTLFTLVNDLTKMQINAAVAEADIGSIAEDQEVEFTVDAFPNRTFNGSVRQVRNAATVNQNVVTYATIIDVINEDLRLKPGMTANVSIVVQQRSNVLRVENGTLRARIPQELLAAASTSGGAGDPAAKAGDGKSNEERMRAMMEVMREIGFQRGTPASAEQIEKAKKLAKEKGLDPEMIAARLSSTGGGRGGRSGRDGGGSGGRSGGGRGGDRGSNNPVVSRTLYRLMDPGAAEKAIEAVNVRLGISDGFYTEVLGGLAEGETVVKSVTMPGAAGVTTVMRNPFQGGGRGYRGR